MAFTQLTGDEGGGGTGTGAFSGGGPGGGPGTGGGNPNFGAARDLALALSSDLQNLIITLTPNGRDPSNNNVTYVIYWLNPALFSISNLGYPSLPGITVLNGRTFVASLPSGSGVISYSTAYLPYTSGGWMYAVVLIPGSTKELTLNGTNYVPVPVLGSGAEPLTATIPTNVALRWTVSGSNRLVQFAWTNSLTPPSYIQIIAVNYWNDGCQRDMAIFKVNTPPGAHQGFSGPGGSYAGAVNDTSQGIILEPDSSIGAHNITWYYCPMNAGLTPLHLTACPNGVTAAIS